MNPAFMAAIPMILTAISGMTGDKAKQGSSYGKNQLGLIDEAIGNIKGGIGGPNQDITQNQGYQQGNQWLSDLFNDPEFFKSFEAPLMRQYEENTIPDLANRFASMGSGGSTGSTGFRNQATREAGNLHANIAALRGGMQQQGVNQQLQYSQQPVQNWMQQLMSVMNPTQNQYTPASPGFGGNIASGIIGGMSQGWGQQTGQNMAGQFPGTENKVIP